MVTKQTAKSYIVSWLIQKKSGKTPLETIPLYINLVGRDVNGAEIPVAIINRKI
jgi:hypothetical protein